MEARRWEKDGLPIAYLSLSHLPHSEAAAQLPATHVTPLLTVVHGFLRPKPTHYRFPTMPSPFLARYGAHRAQILLGIYIESELLHLRARLRVGINSNNLLPPKHPFL